MSCWPAARGIGPVVWGLGPRAWGKGLCNDFAAAAGQGNALKKSPGWQHHQPRWYGIVRFC